MAPIWGASPVWQPDKNNSLGKRPSKASFRSAALASWRLPRSFSITNTGVSLPSLLVISSAWPVRCTTSKYPLPYAANRSRSPRRLPVSSTTNSMPCFWVVRKIATSSFSYANTGVTLMGEQATNNTRNGRLCGAWAAVSLKGAMLRAGVKGWVVCPHSQPLLYSNSHGKCRSRLGVAWLISPSTLTLRVRSGYFCSAVCSQRWSPSSQ